VIDPSIFDEYVSEMSNAIPEMLADVARRERLADEARKRILIPGGQGLLLDRTAGGFVVQNFRNLIPDNPEV
jgi:adenylosuccinate synthase